MTPKLRAVLDGVVCFLAFLYFYILLPVVMLGFLLFPGMSMKGTEPHNFTLLWASRWIWVAVFVVVVLVLRWVAGGEFYRSTVGKYLRHSFIVAAILMAALVFLSKGSLLAGYVAEGSYAFLPLIHTIIFVVWLLARALFWVPLPFFVPFFNSLDREKQVLENSKQ